MLGYRWEKGVQQLIVSGQICLHQKTVASLSHRNFSVSPEAPWWSATGFGGAGTLTFVTQEGDQHLHRLRESATCHGLCVPIRSSLLSSRSDLLTSPGAVGHRIVSCFHRSRCCPEANMNLCIHWADQVTDLPLVSLVHMERFATPMSVKVAT